MSNSPSEVTALLERWGHGDKQALDALTPLVYHELRRIARRQLMKERPDHTLECTALVHEAYLRLVDQHSAQWKSRAHFFGVAAELLRRILVDHARARNAQKRAAVKIPLDQAPEPSVDQDADILAVNDALEELAKFDPQQARIVELRYFAGLTIEETAEVLGISTPTVKRDWTVARAFLQRSLSQRHASPGSAADSSD
jgi:RNA polymerase sigma factor (TIGR02999 family)